MSADTTIEEHIKMCTQGRLNDEMINIFIDEYWDKLNTLSLADKIKYAINIVTTDTYGLACPEFCDFIKHNFDEISLATMRSLIMLISSGMQKDYIDYKNIALQTVRSTVAVIIEHLFQAFHRQQTTISLATQTNRQETMINTSIDTTIAQRQIATAIMSIARVAYGIKFYTTDKDGNKINMDGTPFIEDDDNSPIEGQKDIPKYDPNNDLSKRDMISNMNDVDVAD